MCQWPWTTMLFVRPMRVSVDTPLHARGTMRIPYRIVPIVASALVVLLVGCHENDIAGTRLAPPAASAKTFGITSLSPSGTYLVPISGISYDFTVNNECDTSNTTCRYRSYWIDVCTNQWNDAGSETRYTLSQSVTRSFTLVYDNFWCEQDFAVHVDSLHGGNWYAAAYAYFAVDKSKAMDINIDVSGGPHIWESGTYTYTAYMGSTPATGPTVWHGGARPTGTSASTQIYVDVCTASSPIPLSVTLTAGGRTKTATRKHRRISTRRLPIGCGLPMVGPRCSEFEPVKAQYEIDLPACVAAPTSTPRPQCKCTAVSFHSSSLVSCSSSWDAVIRSSRRQAPRASECSGEDVRHHRNVTIGHLRRSDCRPAVQFHSQQFL